MRLVPGDDRAVRHICIRSIERLLKDTIKKQAPDVIELEDDTPVTKKVKKKPQKN